MRLALAVSPPAAPGTRLTVIAALVDEQGTPRDGELVRFSVLGGSGTLLSLDGATGTMWGTPLGAGRYAMQYQPGTGDATTTLRAEWLVNDQVAATSTIALALSAPATLALRTGTWPLLAGSEQTAQAYVTDAAARPVEGATLNFLVQGGGSLVSPTIMAQGGRYAVRFVATDSSTSIQANLHTPRGRQTGQATAQVGRPSALAALPFPPAVTAREDTIASEHTALVLVAVWDEQGRLVRGLMPDDFRAVVETGDGTAGSATELLLGPAHHSGVYLVPFTAGRQVGTSRLRITLIRGGVATTTATLQVLASGRSSDRQQMSPCGLVVADRALTGLDPALLLYLPQTASQRRVEGLVVTAVPTAGGSSPQLTLQELSFPSGDWSSGVYYAGYWPQTTATTFSLREAQLRTQPATVRLSPATPPTPAVILFPQMGAVGDALVIEAWAPATAPLALQAPPGWIVDELNDTGQGADLVADDGIWSARLTPPLAGAYQVALTGLLGPSGAALVVAPAGGARSTDALATFQVMPQPAPIWLGTRHPMAPGAVLAVEAALTDGQGRLVSGQELVATVVSGGAQLAEGGQLFDDGSQHGSVQDARAGDGVYVGQLSVENTPTGPISLQVSAPQELARLPLQMTINVGTAGTRPPRPRPPRR